MDVQDDKVGVSDDAEAVLDAERCRDPRSRPGAHDLAVHRELGLALEHVEGVGVIRMPVQRDALEVGAEAQLEDLELRELDEDAVLPHARALTRIQHDSVRHGP